MSATDDVQAERKRLADEVHRLAEHCDTVAGSRAFYDAVVAQAEFHVTVNGGRP